MNQAKITVDWEGPGEYRPHIRGVTVHWTRADEPPIAGVRLDSLAAACKITPWITIVNRKDACHAPTSASPRPSSAAR